jgi:DHA2 family methylenomycin A resistance protein-like MFS transporter
MQSLPSSQAGLASGVNNTARQAGGAIGAALFGALAGTPSDPSAFLHGLHAAAIIGAALWICGLFITVTLIRPAHTRHRVRGGDH